MKYIQAGSLWVPWLCARLEYNPGPMAQAIACVEDGTIIAGAMYDHYNGHIVHGHIYIGGIPSREWFVCIFHYPFDVLNVNKLIGQVSTSQHDAIKLDENLGFTRESGIKDYYGEGEDLIVYSMTRDQCKFLNSERWKPYWEKVRGVRNEQNIR